jgi:ABC-2 type transport system ATP-binding protein
MSLIETDPISVPHIVTPLNANPLIATDALTKRYGSVVAIDNLTLTVEPGIVGLVGPNGAGKSTLIKILLGLLAPTGGSATVVGFNTLRDSIRVRELVGYSPEHDCVPGDISAAAFVVHMARMSGIPAAAARERGAEALRYVGLYEERYRPMHGYSTGMKQRVKLAQALVHDPKLLFLDEPTNGLDPEGREEILDLIDRIGREFGLSIIMSSHLLTEIERVCDALIVIDQGRLVEVGSIAGLTGTTSRLLVEVEGSAAEMARRLATAGFEAVADGRRLEIAFEPDDAHRVRDAIVVIAVDAGLPLIRIEQQRHRLEDLFQPASPDVSADNTLA